MNFLLKLLIFFLKLNLLIVYGAPQQNINGTLLNQKSSDQLITQNNTVLNKNLIKNEENTTILDDNENFFNKLSLKYKLDFKESYLNETIYPFIKNCKTSSDFICSAYFDVLIHATKSSIYLFKQNSTIEIKNLTEYLDSDTFCLAFIKAIPDCSEYDELNESVKKLHEKLQEKSGKALCSSLCYEIIDLNLQIKPICYLTMWGYEKLKTLKEKEDKSIKTTTEFVENVKSSFKGNISSTMTQLSVNKTNDIKIDKVSNEKDNNQIKSDIKEPTTNAKIELKNQTMTTTLKPNVTSKNEKITENEKNIDMSSVIEKGFESSTKALTKLKDDEQFDIDNEQNLNLIDKKKIENSDLNGDLEIPGDENVDDDSNMENDHDVTYPSDTLDSSDRIIKGEAELVQRFQSDNKKLKSDPFIQQDDSNFFSYFLFIMLICVISYVAYHNKSKFLALILEGRRSSYTGRGRKKHTAAYRKLDSNLEEAITSNASGRPTQIIY